MNAKHTPGPTMNAGELLMNSPADQVKRCQMVINAIANGEWDDAAHYARNAADEGQGPEYRPWASGMRDLARFCEARAAIAKARGEA